MIAPIEVIQQVRRRYGHTVHEIIAKAGERDHYDILSAIQVLVGSKIYQKLKTSNAERMVFAFTWMAVEVRNGGFHQYFINSAGDFWQDVLFGVDAIGDVHGAVLFRDALSIFPQSSPSSDRVTRVRQLSALEEAASDVVSKHFTAVTDRYLEKSFPRWELLFDYVKAHLDEFDLQLA